MSATTVDVIVFLVIFCAANELNYRSKPVPPSYGDAGIVSFIGWFFAVALVVAVGAGVLWATTALVRFFLVRL